MDLDSSTSTLADVTLDNNVLSEMIRIPADKPLMQLFKRLIGDSKQYTVLTNSQIINILENELNIQVAYIHELVLDIYLNLMKKYLKDWPEWDAFDRQVNTLKATGHYVVIQKILEDKYHQLREYLKEMLDNASPMIRVVAGETMKNSKNKEPKDLEEDIFMEIQCSRAQLNELFLRRPKGSPKVNNIFNVIEHKPDKIQLKKLTLKAILNWWNVEFEVTTGLLSYRRETTHKFTQKLINKKLNEYTEKVDINTSFQKKNIKSYSRNENFVRDIIEMVSVNKIVLNFMNKDGFLDTIKEQIEDDLKEFPSNVTLQGTYRKNMSQYPYVRYMYKEVNNETANSETNIYDLQLQELVVPQYTFTTKDMINFNINKGNSISIKCGICVIIFQGDDIVNRVVSHFNDVHMSERDWQCTNCKKFFNMIDLAENRWQHSC